MVRKAMNVSSSSLLKQKRKLKTSNRFLKMNEHEYMGNLIVEYSQNEFQAFILNSDGDVENKNFSSLDKAKQWIDNNTKTDNNNELLHI